MWITNPPRPASAGRRFVGENRINRLELQEVILQLRLLNTKECLGIMGAEAFGRASLQLKADSEE